MEIVPSETLPANAKSLPDTWIEKIFQKFEDRFGTKWVDKYSASPRGRLKASWAEDLAGFTGEELKRGLSATYKFGAPDFDEFKAACRPPIDHETAFHEAIKQLRLRLDGKDSWSHPAIFYAAQSIGSSDMLNSNWREIGKRWTAALNEFIADMPLPAIPAYAVALPPPGKTSIAPEEAKTRIAATVKQIQPPRDPKAWAHKLIEQHEMGGKPNFKALQMAREVLGMGSAEGAA